MLPVFVLYSHVYCPLGITKILSANHRSENICSVYIRLAVINSTLSGVLHRLTFNLLNGIALYYCHSPG